MKAHLKFKNEQIKNTECGDAWLQGLSRDRGTVWSLQPAWPTECYLKTKKIIRKSRGFPVRRQRSRQPCLAWQRADASAAGRAGLVKDFLSSSGRQESLLRTIPAPGTGCRAGATVVPFPIPTQATAGCKAHWGSARVCVNRLRFIQSAGDPPPRQT